MLNIWCYTWSARRIRYDVEIKYFAKTIAEKRSADIPKQMVDFNTLSRKPDFNVMAPPRIQCLNSARGAVNLGARAFSTSKSAAAGKLLCYKLKTSTKLRRCTTSCRSNECFLI